MKKTNKILSIILAILMVISIIPLTASAETIEGTWGENITWIFNEATGVLTISGYGEISGSKTWSSYSEDIKEIIIEEGITTIPNSAFYSCRALVSVKLPDSVSIINPYAFFFCTSLESVYMGIGVKTIGEYAFNLCFKLKNVYYSGTKTQWNAISFGESNSYITSGPTFYYNSVGDSGHAHIYETVVTTPATCTQNGLGSVVCTICGFSYPTKLTPLGHTNVVVSAVLPTTTAPGHTRIETCSVCDEVILEGIVVPILNETSYTTKSGDYLISVLDQSTDTLTVYGTGTIEYGHELDLFYYEPRNQKVHFNVDTLIITDGITGIGNDAFCYDSLETIIIADSVTYIGNNAFYENEQLRNVYLGNGVKTIGNSAFANCYNLKEFTIGKSVETIGTNAFQTCENLEGFIVDSENTHFSVDENGILYNGDKTELIMFPQSNRTANYEMPSSVKEIRAGAFYECKYLAHAVICDGVTTIPEEAFYNCENLESVVIPKSVTEIGEGAFNHWCGLSIVYYGGTEEEWKELTKSCSIFDRLIMATVYYNYEKLESASGVCGKNLTWTYDADTATLTISGTGEMTEYGYDSDFPWYSYAKDIKKVIISDGVTSISSYAFEGFTGLTSVEIADSVTTIGEYSFAFCDSLKSITLPDSVTLIGDDVFRSCMNLSSVKLSKGLTVLPNSAFAYCINLVDITISDNIEIIGISAFWGCRSLENITLSKNLTAINAGTFGECYSLKAIDIPDSVTIICEDAFYYCLDLETVKIGKGVKTIEECAFYNCDYLDNVYYAGGEHDWNLIDIGPYFSGWLVNNDINFAEAPGHSYTSEITTPATHTENGVITYTCSCGDSYTEAIEILEKHNYESVVTEPTCTEQGYTTYTCVCGDSYVADYVDATGHNYESVVTEPTCTEQGYTTYICVCGDTYVDDYVDALGHTEETIPAVAPSCTEIGLTEGVKCSVCDEILSAQETVDALGHTEETIPAVAPTCTETGLTEGAKCSVCDEILTEQKELPANGHTPANAVEENYVAPTCTENGSKDVVVYCSVCNEEISRETETIEATGHADNDGDGYCDADNKLLDPSVECNHACHKDGISGFLWRIINVFNMLFGLNKTCSCGVAHY